MQFMGEEVYLFIGVVDKFVKPTSDEGDAWKGSKFMSFDKASKLLKKYLENNT